MSHKSVTHGMPTGIRRRITGPHKLNPLQLDPNMVWVLPETFLLSQLPQESNYILSTIFVFIRQVNLITKDHQIFINLFGFKSYSFCRFIVLTVMFKLFQNHRWGRRRTEVYENHIIIGETSQS